MDEQYLVDFYEGMRMLYHEGYQLEHSEVKLESVHDAQLCHGEFCTIHYKSNHSKRWWAQAWQNGRMWRVDPSDDVHYLDPDSPGFDKAAEIDGRTITETYIIRNSAQCLDCGDIIESLDRHHFATCSCGNLSVDGGQSYIRRVFQDESRYKDLNEEKEIEFQLYEERYR